MNVPGPTLHSITTAPQNKVLGSAPELVRKQAVQPCPAPTETEPLHSTRFPESFVHTLEFEKCCSLSDVERVGAVQHMVMKIKHSFWETSLQNCENIWESQMVHQRNFLCDWTLRKAFQNLAYHLLFPTISNVFRNFPQITHAVFQNP